MKKLSMLCCAAALLTLVACKAKPTFQDVKLGNGAPGFMMACPAGMGEDECLTYAKGYCHGSEYNLIARNVGNKSNVMLLSCK
jgi:hypothetical protein